MNIQVRTIKEVELIFDRGRQIISFGVDWKSPLNGVIFNICCDEDVEFIFSEIEKLFNSARNPKEKYSADNWTKSIGDFHQIGKKLACKYGKADASAFWTVTQFASID